MNANELADELLYRYADEGGNFYGDDIHKDVIEMLRQQQDKLTKYELRHAEQRKRIEELEGCINDCYTVQKMQADEVHKVEAEIDKLKQVLQSIANEHIELSHDKIKWQCEDHVRWAKEVLK